MPTFRPVSSLRGKNITSADQFTRADIDALCSLAMEMQAHIEQKRMVIDDLKGRIMTPLFFEDSSRTLSSFCAAMLRLGGGVVDFKVTSSSMNKGESLEDTVRTLNAYSDVLVLRHPKVEALDQAVKVLSENHGPAIQHATPGASLTTTTAPHTSSISNEEGDLPAYENENHNNSVVINGGNGSGEHPTQALLDTLTMQAELGHIDGLTVALIGDLKMGRTVHSLLKLLTSNYNLKRVYLVAPEGLQMPQYVVDQVMPAVRARDSKLEVLAALSPAVVADCDVLYCTRLQKERFLDDPAGLVAFEAAKSGIRIDTDRLRDAKARMIVMHPLPRVDELTPDVDNDPRCAYFRQMRYGLFMRMALLYSVLL